MINNQIKASGQHRWIKRKQLWIFVGFVIIITAYLTWDYRGPSEITLQADIAFGLRCLRAKDLFVQGHDPEGHLWATRGMVAYRFSETESMFIRQYHIPTGLSIFWLRNFSIVRRLTLRPECVELLPLLNGEASVMSAGHMWYRPGQGEDFEETLAFNLLRNSYRSGYTQRWFGQTKKWYDPFWRVFYEYKSYQCENIRQLGQWQNMASVSQF